MYRDYHNPDDDPDFSTHLELNLDTIVPSVSGPKRPHDYIKLSDMKKDFTSCLSAPAGFKGFGKKEEELNKKVSVDYKGKKYELTHGSVVIAAITSCTNTSNPSVMIGAGLVAKKANELGLSVKNFVKTSLAPGSNVVTKYLEKSELLPHLKQLGFNIVGYGCTTCIGNSGPLPSEISDAIEENDLICCGVLSGNRNFEGRIHPNVPANYLASPPLVVAYAIAGTTNIDFENDPLGKDKNGNDVFLRDIWPTTDEIRKIIQENVLKEFFHDVYKSVTCGTEQWNSLEVTKSVLYPWDKNSTYIHRPPFFEKMIKDVEPITKVDKARCLLNLGNSITTDHISPAGAISIKSPAARYLKSRGIERDDFNSYGARRGNDEVMVRGTFANVRLVNKFLEKVAPKTIHLPSGDVLDVYDAAERYTKEETPLIILAGENYGSGSSRDWAAKGVWMQNVKAVIAQNFERIHRSNLVLFGVLPFEFEDNENADTLGLTGKEEFSFDIGKIEPGKKVTIHVANGSIDKFTAILRIDTESEASYYSHGGVLNYVIRTQLSKNKE